MPRLDALIIEPTSPAQASVIWLHGLGANGNDFAPIVPALNLPDILPIRFIFPHAPTRPITINGGYAMPGWFDIYGLHPDSQQDEAGIAQTKEAVIELIHYENTCGIPSEKIVLAGFSQGGAMALHVGTHYENRLGGIIALSTYLPLHYAFGERISAANRDIPVFLAHGSFDEILQLSFGELTRDLLQQNGYPIDWHVYPMAHTVCPEEVDDLSHWLQQRFKK